MELMKLRPNPLEDGPGGGGGGCDAADAEEGFVPEKPSEAGEVRTSFSSIVMQTGRLRGEEESLRSRENTRWGNRRYERGRYYAH